LPVAKQEDILEEVNYKQNHFERKFFSEETNRVFCKTFIENGLKDPINGEFGKSLVLLFRKITLQNWLNCSMNMHTSYSRASIKATLLCR
jgi:hypothetical protein